jgi:hypothetical protein
MDYLKIIYGANPDEFNDMMASYLETYHEMVLGIERAKSRGNIGDPQNIVQVVYEERGTGGMYELAKEWTDEFQKVNEDAEWDGEFFDEIEMFFTFKLAEKQYEFNPSIRKK